MNIFSKVLNLLRPGHEKGTPSSEGGVSKRHAGPYDDSPIPRVTIHSLIMGVFVSIGGFIFGYDIGQVSGFLGASRTLHNLCHRLTIVNRDEGIPAPLWRKAS